MYGQPSTTSPRADFLVGHHSQSTDDMAAPPPFPPSLFPVLPPSPDHLVIPDQLLAALEVAGSGPSGSPSGCSSYGGGGSPSSLCSCAMTRRPSFIQRSTSSQALYKNGHHCHFVSPQDFLDMKTSPVRRVFSTGDLQHSQRSDSPISSESSMIIESMSRACKYSPEEKKERIERYRSKRNQRNFTKKIKYTCRKTLADSRPRIRGRFARNDEIEKNPQLPEWSNIVSGEEEDEDENNWTHFLDAFSANYSSP